MRSRGVWGGRSPHIERTPIRRWGGSEATRPRIDKKINQSDRVSGRGGLKLGLPSIIVKQVFFAGECLSSARRSHPAKQKAVAIPSVGLRVAQNAAGIDAGDGYGFFFRVRVDRDPKKNACGTRQPKKDDEGESPRPLSLARRAVGGRDRRERGTRGGAGAPRARSGGAGDPAATERETRDPEPKATRAARDGGEGLAAAKVINSTQQGNSHARRRAAQTRRATARGSKTPAVAPR